MARKRRTKAEILAAESKGLGDTVEKVLEVTGIAKVAKWLLGEDCGCDERKEKLNKMFRYKKILCLTEQEHERLKLWFDKNTSVVRPSEQKMLFEIHSRIFQVRNELTSCASCVTERVNDLRKVFNEYKDEQKSE
jgi:chaperonin GroEL (HSP60 family)